MNNTLILNPSFVIKSLKWPITLRMFWILSILLLVSLLVFYIFQVNAETSERYLVQRYEERIDEISRENQSLEISSVQINSLDNIIALLEEGDGGEANFEKIDKIYYIRVSDSQIVTK